MDIFLLGFHCLQAKFENDNKALDVRAGMRKAAEMGNFPNCPPIGYLPDKGGIKGARKREIDPEKFPIVRRIWDYALRGNHSTKELLTLANETWGLRTRSGEKLTTSKLYRILSNPFYYGEYEWPLGSGNWYKGNHVPVITKREFDKLRRMMGKAGRPRPRKNYMTYGGCLFRCGACGNAITGYEKVKQQQNGNTHRYEYYYCARQKRSGCTEKPTTSRVLETQIEGLLTDIWIPKSVVVCVHNRLEAMNEALFKDVYVQHNQYDEQIAALEAKLNRLIDMCAAGTIEDAQLASRTKEIRAEQKKLRQQVQETDITVADKFEKVCKLFSFSEQSVKSFKSGSPEAKRGIVSTLCTDLRISGQKLDLSREKWIVPVTEVAKRLRLKEVVYCPVLSPLNKAKIENLLKSDVMCSLMGEVLTALDKTDDLTELNGKIN